MPHNKSTQKRLRQNAKERAYNRAVRSGVRSVVKSARKAEGEAAAAELVTVYSSLDRAVKKGVVPKRRAARLKSRLARRARSQTS